MGLTATLVGTLSGHVLRKIQLYSSMAHGSAGGYQGALELQQSLSARAQLQPLLLGFTRVEHQTIMA